MHTTLIYSDYFHAFLWEEGRELTQAKIHGKRNILKEC